MDTAVTPRRSVFQLALDHTLGSARQSLRSPRALWGVNLSYVIEGIVYFGLLTVLGKFCAENIGLSDLHSGWIYSAVTGGITFAMLLLGGVCDGLGMRRGLVLSLCLMAAGYAVVAGSGMIARGPGTGSAPLAVLLGGLFLVVIGFGIYKPAVYAGVKRYARPEDAAMAYAVVYGMVNLGSFFAGIVSPIVRQSSVALAPPNGLTAVFWVYCGLACAAVVLTLAIITRRADAAAAAVGQELTTRSQGGEALSAWDYLRIGPGHPFRDMRFVAFIFILIPVQTLLAHQWLTVPYYCDRAFKGSAVSQYFEFFSNLNPLVIFVAAPLIASLTARTGVYRMMIWGTLVMAVPTFLLAVGPNTPLFIVYIVLMSVGEAMWQPRFLQWVAEIAPPGRAGIYMGIGQFPWFLTKLLTGLYSGYFVEHYCPRPETGLSMRTGEMWVIYGVIAMVSPVALVLGRRCMGRGSDGREM